MSEQAAKEELFILFGYCFSAIIVPKIVWFELFQPIFYFRVLHKSPD